jgi:hypothetical protein
MHPNLDFPISFYKDMWSVTAISALRKTKFKKHTVLFSQENDVVDIVYNATGRLEAHHHFGRVDQRV